MNPINQFATRFQVEYARKGNSICRECSKKIPENVLRMAFDEVVRIF